MILAHFTSKFVLCIQKMPKKREILIIKKAGGQVMYTTI